MKSKVSIKATTTLNWCHLYPWPGSGVPVGVGLTVLIVVNDSTAGMRAYIDNIGLLKGIQVHINNTIIN